MKYEQKKMMNFNMADEYYKPKISRKTRNERHTSNNNRANEEQNNAFALFSQCSCRMRCGERKHDGVILR